MPMQPLPLDQRLTLVKVLAHATPAVQVIIFGLILAVMTSVALWAVQAPGGRSRESAQRTLAFLSAVLIVGPLLGLTAASYGLLDMSIGIANVRPTPDLSTLAPGLAEASLCVLLGLLAAAFAAGFRAHLAQRLAD